MILPADPIATHAAKCAVCAKDTVPAPVFRFRPDELGRSLWGQAPPVRILFAALHNGYYRNLDSVVDELARRGHDIHLGAERDDSSFGGQPIVDRLTAAHANVTSRAHRDARSGLALPAGKDPIRDRLPAVSRTRVRALVRFVAARAGAHADRNASPIQFTGAGLAPDQAPRDPHPRRRGPRCPSSPDIERYLDQQRPDLMVITPLIGLVASSQIDLLRSAIRRGIATAVMVWSWDHLSSKAIIRDLPDALFVWNDVQKREAMQMHGVPEARIVVTGAQCYDRWFGRIPARSRTEFVRHAGSAR